MSVQLSRISELSLFCIVVLTGFVFTACSGRQISQKNRSSPRETLTVAVMPFQVQHIQRPVSGSPVPISALSRSLVDQIEEKFIGYPGVSLVDREEIDQVFQELFLSSHEASQSAVRLRLGRLLGAQYLVMGTYTLVGKALRMDARIVEVERGRVVGSVSMDGSVTEREAIERSFSEKIVATFLSSTRRSLPEKMVSSDDHYLKGRSLEREKNFTKALVHYKAAFSLNPENHKVLDRIEALSFKEME